MADNSITVTGNITRDPELRFAASGNAQVTFGLAVNRRWQNRQSQEWEESTSFFDVVCWGSLAENVADSVAKGTRVVVSGRLEQRSWETTDGEKRSKVEIIADELGPSLRWATAKVQKSDRRGQGPGGGGGGGNYGGGGRGGFDSGRSEDDAPRRPQGRDNLAPATSPAGAYEADEEPF
jgi:single-strand DNA-binding protein